MAAACDVIYMVVVAEMKMLRKKTNFNKNGETQQAITLMQYVCCACVRDLCPY